MPVLEEFYDGFDRTTGGFGTNHSDSPKPPEGCCARPVLLFLTARSMFSILNRTGSCDSVFQPISEVFFSKMKDIVRSFLILFHCSVPFFPTTTSINTTITVY